jgi:hypothetical protein
LNVKAKSIFAKKTNLSGSYRKPRFIWLRVFLKAAGTAFQDLKDFIPFLLIVSHAARFAM